jgi:hypothetical protein
MQLCINLENGWTSETYSKSIIVETLFQDVFWNVIALTSEHRLVSEMFKLKCIENSFHVNTEHFAYGYLLMSIYDIFVTDLGLLAT